MALRCAGGGAAAYLPLPGTRGSGAALPTARFAATATGTSGQSLLLRASSSPCSRGPWTLRCSPEPPLEAERSVSNGGRNGEAWKALKAMITGTSRPFLRNLADVLSLRTLYDLKDYQLGMLSGAFLLLVGVYKMWKAAPGIFLDATIGYMVYKLSVLSSELDRQRKPNSLITRLIFGIILVMFAKETKTKYELLDAIRVPLFLMYLGTFIFDVAGMKKYGRRALISFVNLLKTRGGVEEICRIMWYPGYISPYDDGFEWK